MYVIPAPGRTSRDPVTKRLLPPEGADVPRTGFWLRRIRDKDVLETEAPAATDQPGTETPPPAAPTA